MKDECLPFSSCFVNYILVIVVSQTSGQFLIVHLWFVFPDAPPSSHLIRIHHLELPTISCPGYEALAGLVSEQLQQELPQLDGT